MSQLTVTKQGAEVMADNPLRVDVADYTSGWREFKPAQPREDWRPIVARAAVGVGAFLVLALAYGIWKSLYCWLGGWEVVDTCRGITRAEPLAVALLALATFGVTLWRITSAHQAELRQRQAYRNRTNLVLDRFGNQTPADLFDRMDARALLAYLERRYATDVALKVQTAPHERYWGVNALTEGDRVEPEALPAPAELAALPPSEWLSWLDEVPHVLLAAETGGGKSTTAKAILAPRVAGGEQAYIIDPHSDVWFDLPIMGGGENWNEVRQALRQVSTEYRRRILEREEHRVATRKALPKTHWPRLTVLLDEANITKLRLDTGPRGQPTPWQEFAQVLGSGARKVHISIVLLCQSANTDDLGISGPMRENFLRIALDSAAAHKLVDSGERDAERKKQLHAALAGRQYPAVCEYEGQVHLLDRTGLDKVPTPPDSQLAAWQPAPLPAECTPEERLRTMIRELKAMGVTRKAAREEYGLSFDNNTWGDDE